MVKSSASKKSKEAAVKENRFVPMHMMLKYESKGYYRILFLIDVDPSRLENKENYKIFVDEDTEEFVFQLPYPKSWLSSHPVLSFLTTVFRRIFGADSTLARAFGLNALDLQEKSPVKGAVPWATFRKKLPFACQAGPANDLPNAGVTLTKLDGDGTLMVELKSKDRIPEIQPIRENSDLVLTTFMSPKKVTGADSDLGQLVNMYEQLMASGITVDQIKCMPMFDGMDIDGMDKRRKRSGSDDDSL
mmetsp:Transcript_26837/g.65223  ORF Transcript_26837/g.65223 Transcript_26837/m.65223 type:complete len:246 (+) Transcript_26837:168-905(+)